MTDFTHFAAWLGLSELHLGLIFLGIFFLLLVILYNRWQERRYGKLAQAFVAARQEEPPSHRHEPPTEITPDMLEMPSAPVVRKVYGESLRQEPVLHDENTPSSAIPFDDEEDLMPKGMAHRFESPPQEKDEPMLAPAFQEDEPQRLPPSEEEMPEEEALPSPKAVLMPKRADAPPPLPLSFLSPQIDYIVTFNTLEPISPGELIEPVYEMLLRLKKPVRFVGYNAFSNEWDSLSSESMNTYEQYRIGIALADRQGALQDAELSAFCLCLQELATKFSAMTDFPPRALALDTALKLDDFCASVDIQVGINVSAQMMPFQGTKIRTLMASEGMSLDADGRFVKRDDEANVLYVLQNQEVAGFTSEGMKSISTRGVTFLLDVPCVANGERVFMHMVERARHFAEVMRGILVDDHKRPLNDGGLEPIRAQIAHYQALMATRGYPAGAPLTRRLFS